MRPRIQLQRNQDSDSTGSVLLAIDHAKAAWLKRVKDGRPAPASPFLDAVAGYDAPVRLNPPPQRRRKPNPGRAGGDIAGPRASATGIEKSVPNGDQG